MRRKVWLRCPRWDLPVDAYARRGFGGSWCSARWSYFRLDLCVRFICMAVNGALGSNLGQLTDDRTTESRHFVQPVGNSSRPAFHLGS